MSGQDLYFFNQQEMNIFNKFVVGSQQTQSSSYPAIKRNSPKKQKHRDAINRRLNNIGKPGTKRRQRYMNAKYIKDLENMNEDYNDEIVEEDDWFNCSTENPFYFDFEQEFIDVTEEKQKELLNQFKSDKALKKKQEKIGRLPKQLLNEMIGCVDKNGYSDFICSVEEQIVEFLQFIGEGFENEEENCNWKLDNDDFQISQKESHTCEVFLGDKETNPRIIFSFSNSFERRLCHGVSHYYGIQSKSVDVDNGRKTIISVPKSLCSLPQEPIIHYLRSKK